jgi:hypothetical protein
MVLMAIADAVDADASYDRLTAGTDLPLSRGIGNDHRISGPRFSMLILQTAQIAAVPLHIQRREDLSW